MTDEPTTAAPEPSDVELLQAHAGGDADAFGTLIGRHQDRLWAVALRTTGDREDAADALQDAFISAHRAAARFRGDSQVSTWLHRIVVNACYDRLRRRQARPQAELPDDVHVADPRDDFAASDTAHVVTAALARLADDQRIALVLIDIQGHSVEEAAAILEVPTGTVKSRCSRGRARLAILLADLAPGNRTTGASVQPTSTETEGGGA